MSLTQAQQAAVVLAQLDDDRAQVLLSRLPEPDVVRLMAEVARLPTVPVDDIRDVVASFVAEADAVQAVRQGGIDRARRMLTDRLGTARAAEVLSRVDTTTEPAPFGFLDQVPAPQVAAFLAEEHPQTVAVVLSNMAGERAARVLDALGHDGSSDVVRRIATLGQVSPAALQLVAEVLENRFFNVLGLVEAEGSRAGVPAAAAVLSYADRATEKEIFSHLEACDPELAEAIRNEMFVFDDVAQLDDRTLQVVLRSVAPRDLAIALKAVDEEVVARFRRNLSERVAADLDEEVASLGPQRLSSVEAAQADLVKTVRGLADAGTITLGRPDDELVV